MKRIVLLVVVLLAVAVNVSFAVPGSKDLEFDSSMGKVIFSGKVHKDAGLKCKDCHNKDMFPKMKKGTVTITMEDIYAGKYCGACHNGERAFQAKSSCGKCHVK